MAPRKKADEQTTNTPGAEQKATLENLSVLAARHRIPPWQQAALMRCMGWADGKMVTDAEYRQALERIKNRPMGGGRLA